MLPGLRSGTVAARVCMGAPSVPGFVSEPDGETKSEVGVARASTPDAGVKVHVLKGVALVQTPALRVQPLPLTAKLLP